MDMYLSPPDTFNLQEMLDCDIKCEMGDGFGLDCDLPPLDLDDESHHAWIHGNSNSSFELDFFGTDSSASLMVNPHTIMPLPTLQLAQQQIMKHEVIDIKMETPSTPPSPAPSDNLDDDEAEEEEEDEEEEDEFEDVKPSFCASLKTMKVDPLKLTLTTTASSVHKTVTSVSSSNNLTANGVMKSEAAASPYTPSSTKSKRPVVNSRKQLCLNDAMLYPKPAYSYSCLIALALKNSPSGSLPVSEIYNFMCRHFPYFKSAPNGWKNSVRHNLSLNKCFEKIEKPVMGGEGGAQRKGCLWAMNPNRMAKMDDEVAKWSRKDPLAIRRSMLNPDHLELLERGDLQVGWTPGDFAVDGDGDDSNEEANDDSDATMVAIAASAATATAATTTSAATSRPLPQQQLQQKVAPIRIRTVVAAKVRPTATVTTTTTTTAEVLRQEVVHQQQRPAPTVVKQEAEEEDEDEEEEEEEEEEDEEEEDEEVEDEDEEEEEDDGPQPIGSDESEDELSRMPPSLQPFEPRLALAKKFNEAQKELRLGGGRSQHHDIELSSDILDALNWTEMPRFKSRSLLSMDVTVPVSDYTDVFSSSENTTTRTIATNGSRKRSAAAPIARIQGNYVCVKRKVTPICRSVK